MGKPWTISDAKAQLSEIIRLAYQGEPQIIGTQKPCVLVTEAYFQTLIQANAQHRLRMGDALIKAGAMVSMEEELQLPSRKEHRAIIKFED